MYGNHLFIFYGLLEESDSQGREGWKEREGVSWEMGGMEICLE